MYLIRGPPQQFTTVRIAVILERTHRPRCVAVCLRKIQDGGMWASCPTGIYAFNTVIVLGRIWNPPLR